MRLLFLVAALGLLSGCAAIQEVKDIPTSEQLIIGYDNQCTCPVELGETREVKDIRDKIHKCGIPHQDHDFYIGLAVKF